MIMKRTVFSLAAVLAVASIATGAWACPGEDTCRCPKGQTVAQTDAGKPAGCGGAAATVVDAKSSCGAWCGKGCSGPCGQSCDKPCCQGSATLTSDKVVKSGCSGSKTVADKPAGFGGGAATVVDARSSCSASCGKGCSGSCGQSCDKPCCQKSATLTSDKVVKSGCSGSKTVTKSTANEPDIEAVLASFPSMKYRIGDETIGCSKSAESVAKQNHQPIHYLVGDSAFENKAEAKAKLASLLEKEIENLKTVQFVVGGKCHHCPITARKIAEVNGENVIYRVGGLDFDSKDRAESVSELVGQKLADVKMTYKVGDESFCCDKMAGMTAKKTGKPMHYVGEVDVGRGHDSRCGVDRRGRVRFVSRQSGTISPCAIAQR
jgi:hypothetical protein